MAFPPKATRNHLADAKESKPEEAENNQLLTVSYFLGFDDQLLILVLADLFTRHADRRPFLSRQGRDWHRAQAHHQALFTLTGMLIWAGP